MRPLFVLEVVSPRYRDADILRKPDIYRKAGVAKYVIVDPGLRKNRISYTVGGYRMSGGRYVKIEPDAQGRIRSLTTGVLIGVNETGDRLVVLNAATGEEIPSDEERADSAEEELRRLRARLEAMGISTD